MGASVASADRRMTFGFLVGRTLGVLALLLFIGLLGAHLLPSKEWLVIIFAVSTIGVAAFIAASTFRPSLLGGCGGHKSVSCDGGELEDGTAAGSCSEGCDGCAAGGEGRAGEHVGCTNIPQSLLDRVSGQSPWMAGMAVGGFRGASPCLKVLIITPLLVASPPGTVVAMALAFTATSMVYSVIGLLSGKVLAERLQRAWYLRLAGATGVAAVGIYTLWRFYVNNCVV
jgi:hypothetical protein